MQTSLETLGELERRLTMSVPVAQIESEIQHRLARLAKNVKVPGFRPGKTPPRVIKQRFKEQILHEVAHDLIPRAVGDALRERGVEPVDTPDVRDVRVVLTAPFTNAGWKIVRVRSPWSSSRGLPCSGGSAGSKPQSRDGGGWDGRGVTVTPMPGAEVPAAGGLDPWGVCACAQAGPPPSSTTARNPVMDTAANGRLLRADPMAPPSRIIAPLTMQAKCRGMRTQIRRRPPVLLPGLSSL